MNLVSLESVEVVQILVSERHTNRATMRMLRSAKTGYITSIASKDMVLLYYRFNKKQLPQLLRFVDAATDGNYQSWPRWLLRFEMEDGIEDETKLNRLAERFLEVPTVVSMRWRPPKPTKRGEVLLTREPVAAMYDIVRLLVSGV